MQCTTNNNIEKFIKKNPYPEFKEMEELQSMRLDLDSEYCIFNHNLCKRVYSSMHHPDNKNYVDQWVNSIKNTGGSQALKCNLESMLLFSPIAQCKEEEVLKKFKEIYDYVITQLN